MASEVIEIASITIVSMTLGLGIGFYLCQKSYESYKTKKIVKNTSQVKETAKKSADAIRQPNGLYSYKKYQEGRND